MEKANKDGDTGEWALQDVMQEIGSVTETAPLPEATKEICQKEVPGIPEAIRAYSMTITNRAMLSRATAGIRKKTLIINLPGSPKAVKESLEYIIGALGHGIEIMTGETGNCAR